MPAAVRAADYSHELAGPHKISAPQNLSPTESLWQFILHPELIWMHCPGIISIPSQSKTQ